MVTKVMFLQASVILSMGGVSASVHVGIPHTPSPGADPPEQTPPRANTTLRADTHPSRSRHPPGSRHPPPPGADTPWSRHTPESRHPPPKAGSSIWSMSGRYASYWNAILFKVDFQPTYCMGSTKFPKVMFLQVSVCPRAGMRGCSWGACMVAPRGGLGMHGCSGGWCMAKGACVAKGGMHGKGGHVWQKGGHAW